MLEIGGAEKEGSDSGVGKSYFVGPEVLPIATFILLFFSSCVFCSVTFLKCMKSPVACTEQHVLLSTLPPVGDEVYNNAPLKSQRRVVVL